MDSLCVPSCACEQNAASFGTMHWTGLSDALSRVKSSAPAGVLLSYAGTSPATRARKLLTMELAKGDDADLRAVAAACATANALLVAGILEAARECENDLAYWRRRMAPASWLKRRTRLPILRSVPEPRALRRLDELIDALHVHVGSLKVIANHPFIGPHLPEAFADGRGVTVAHNDPTELCSTIAACCKMNSQFLAIINTSADNRSGKSLKSIVDEIRLNCGTAVPRSSGTDDYDRHSSAGSVQDDAFFTASSAFSRFYDENGMEWNKSTCAKQLVPSTSEVIVSVQTLLSHIDSFGSVNSCVQSFVASEGCNRPGRIERNGLLLLVSSCATVHISREVFARSRYLGGSGQLERSLADAKSSLAGFISWHVTEPLSGIYEQVLANVTTSSSVISRNEENLIESQRSLDRMVANYISDHPELHGMDGIAAVLSSFEGQVRHPVKNTLSGELIQTILVITAKLKSDVEEILVRTNKQLAAQKINLHILAAVPAVLGIAGIMYVLSLLLGKSRQRGAAVRSSGEEAARYCIGDCRDVLQYLLVEAGSSTYERRRCVGKLVSLLNDLDMLLSRHLLHVKAETLSRIRQDISKLESQSLSVQTRISVIDRMFHVYPLLQKTT